MSGAAFALLASAALAWVGCETPPHDRLQEIAENLASRLWGRWRNTSCSTFLEAQHNLTSETVERVNGSAVAAEVAASLTDSLSLFRLLLNETATFSESLYSMHQNQNCCSSVCQYGMGYDEDLCSMSCNGSSIKYISSGRGFGIGMETGWNGTRQCVMGSWSEDTCIAPEEELGSGDSAVHIPRDVHEEDPQVLCFVQWTDQLSQQFSSNLLSLNSTLNSNLSQYVGTDSRLFRFSPPSDWSSLSQCDRCPLTLQDTFELGRRPWYTNTVTGDKFIVILLDVSGSMAGFQSVLARTTISQLLRSLTPNDHFLLSQVGEGERTSNVSCFSEKTRATPENVLVASRDILSLRDTNNIGRAYFSQPLQDSLLLLGDSTECHRVLIIFSDGDKETWLPTDLVRKFNRDKKVQVFSLLVGGGTDDANLGAVACENGGRMGRIREYSDIIPAVLVITDSLKLPTSRNVHFTAYRDISGRLALTMGLPLWKVSTNETFGIIGFDIPYPKLLDEALQHQRIGASGYVFIVDNNGQLVSHPAISQEFIEALSDDSLLSLDVDYFENAVLSAQWEELRWKMLSRGCGQTSLVTWALLEEGYVLRNTTYSYAPVEGTPFVVVVVTPADLWVASSLRSEVITQLSPLGGRSQCESGRGLCEGLQRVEAELHSPTDLTVLSSGGGCGNLSSVALLRSLEVEGHSVGVVGPALSPEEVEKMLEEVMGGREAEEEVYLLDEGAKIIAAYPYNHTGGWFPGLYPDVVLGEMFENGTISGREPRPLERGRSGVCEGGEGGEGEWVCEKECQSTELYVRERVVYQLRANGEERADGEITCTNGNLTYVIERVPNTSLTLVVIAGPCLHGNITGCTRQPIRYQCLPCVCGAGDKFRAPPHDLCPNNSDHIITSLCSELRPHPSSPVTIAASILSVLILAFSG